MSKVSLTFNIVTKDAESFRRSQHQLLTRWDARFSLMPQPDMSKFRFKDWSDYAVRPSLLKRLGQMVKAVLAGKEDWK